MKVICIGNKNKKDAFIRFKLAIGKEYECIGEDESSYLILFKDRFKIWFSKEIFINISEYRNKRLEELGI